MNLSKKVIYIADDDDDDDRYFMSRSLREIDPSVTIVEAKDGSKLMTLLDTWSQEPAPRPVHLILLDVNMPKMNGLEALMAIKANSLLRHIPTVMISTSAGPVQMATAYQNGASGYIEKPGSYAQIGQIARAVSVCYLNGVVD